MENKFLAKTKQTKSLNLYLYDHTKMVINLGMHIAQKIYQGKEEDKNLFMKHLFLSLVLHDIGKIANVFQDYMNKNKSELDEEGLEIAPKKKLVFFYHNMISWAFAVTKIYKLRDSNWGKSVLISLLWHHMGHDSRDTNNIAIFETLSSQEIGWMERFYQDFIEYSMTHFGIDLSDYEISEYNEDKPSVKTNDYNIYSYTTDIAKLTDRERYYENDSYTYLMRSIVIYADRLVSGENCNLQKIYDNDTKYISTLIEGKQSITYQKEVDFFSFGYDNKRLSKQISILDSLTCNHTVIKACAGFGKTLLGLMWFFKEKKRLLWVVPRNAIAISTYMSIIHELKRMGINDKIKVGLYLGNQLIEKNCGETQFENFDIFVTNIDNIVKHPTTNNKADVLLNMYTSNVIFDEYHEFVMPHGIFAAFIHMMRIRARLTPSKTLLMSATARNFDSLWGSHIVDYKNDTDILYGDTKINIDIKTYNDVNELKINDNVNRFVITYTVPEAQRIYLNTPNGINKDLIHSRYTQADRIVKTQKLLKKYAKEAKNKETNLIGTNIIGTGLDISCQEMYDFVISPENTIQRCCGRASRFGEYAEITYNACKVTKKRNKIITENYTESLYNKWFDKISEYNGKQITKEKLYNIYEDFQKDNIDEIEQFYIENFNNSLKELCDLSITKGTSKNVNTTKLASGLGYRGYNNSIFVTAINEEGEWSDPINVDFDTIEKDEEEFTDKRKKAIKHTIKKYKYPNNSELRYKYKIDGTYTLQKFIKMAKDEQFPLPCFVHRYSKELGLYNMNIGTN